MDLKTQMKVNIALIYFAFLIGLALSAPESALVTKVPGFSGNLPSKHYAGYVLISFLICFFP